MSKELKPNDKRIRKFYIQYPRIVWNPEILAGRPTIANTRLSVEQVLGQIYVLGSIESVVEYYGGMVDKDDVLDALAFAQDVIELIRDTENPPEGGEG